MCYTRLAYGVDIMSIFMARPKSYHLAATKRIMSYIRGTIDCGILFPSTDKGKK